MPTLASMKTAFEAITGEVRLAFILIDNDAWTVILGAFASFVYLLVSQGNSWETRFILFIVILFAMKFFRELKGSYNGKNQSTDQDS